MNDLMREVQEEQREKQLYNIWKQGLSYLAVFGGGLLVFSMILWAWNSYSHSVDAQKTADLYHVVEQFNPDKSAQQNNINISKVNFDNLSNSGAHVLAKLYILSKDPATDASLKTDFINSLPSSLDGLKKLSSTSLLNQDNADYPGIMTDDINSFNILAHEKKWHYYLATHLAHEAQPADDQPTITKQQIISDLRSFYNQIPPREEVKRARVMMLIQTVMH